MKRRVLEVLLLLVIVGVTVAGVRYSAERSHSLVGEWAIQGKTHDFQMTFTGDGRILLDFGSVKAEGEYSVAASPDEWGVYFFDAKISEASPARAILRFETADRILFQEAISGESRPTSFDHRAVKLYRVTEAP